MKTLNEMTELQILSLTDKQVEDIVKYRKAQEGIKLLQKPIEPEYEEEVEKDVIFFKVKNLETIRFSTSEKASEVSKFLSEVTKDEYYSRWDKEPTAINKLTGYEREYVEFTMSEQKEYSPALAESAKQIKKRNEEAKRIYDEAKSEYEKYTDEIQWIIDEVWDKVIAVRNKYSKLAQLQNDYSEYLVLAGNDEKIATAFLTKANAISDDDLKIVKGKKIAKFQ